MENPKFKIGEQIYFIQLGYIDFIKKGFISEIIINKFEIKYKVGFELQIGEGPIIGEWFIEKKKKDAKYKLKKYFEDNLKDIF